jgi:hypothetical protein
MALKKIDFDTVRKLARDLPGVEESTIHGSPALKFRGQMLACIPVHKSAEPGSLAVRVDLESRTEMLAAAPETYYVTDHYLPYPIVLVRLSRISSDALKDLLAMGFRFVSAKKSKTVSGRRRR